MANRIQVVHLVNNLLWRYHFRMEGAGLKVFRFFAGRYEFPVPANRYSLA